jgi:hypothetical protein
MPHQLLQGCCKLHLQQQHQEMVLQGLCCTPGAQCQQDSLHGKNFLPGAAVLTVAAEAAEAAKAAAKAAYPLHTFDPAAQK